MKLSATRIKMYLSCPRQFRYAYIDEIPAVPTGPLVFGRVIHEVLHNLHLRSLESGADLDLAYGLEEFGRLWREALEYENPFFKNGDADSEQYRHVADSILRGHVAAQQDQVPPLLVEFAFELPWHFSGQEHLLCGVIDRIDEGRDGLVIVDYKSGQRKPSAKDVAGDLQLTIYAFAVEQILGQAVEEVVYYHLRDQMPLLATRGENDFRHLCEHVMPQVVQAIEAGHFEPRPGYYCRWCDHRELCRAEGI